MPTPPAKVKKSVEDAVALKGLGASAAEGKTAARLCGQVADDLETSAELRSVASYYHSELLDAQGTQAREGLMARLAGALGKFT